MRQVAERQPPTPQTPGLPDPAIGRGASCAPLAGTETSTSVDPGLFEQGKKLILSATVSRHHGKGDNSSGLRLSDCLGFVD